MTDEQEQQQEKNPVRWPSLFVIFIYGNRVDDDDDDDDYYMILPLQQ